MKFEFKIRSMHEESIYRILDAFSDENDQSQVNRKESIKRPLKKGEFVLPTGSTFINHSTVRPGVCNLAGNKSPSSILQQHRGRHSMFGPNKSSLNQSVNTDLKPKRHNLLPPLTKLELKENLTPKPPIPRADEQPIMGLSSNIDFVEENRRQTLSLKPKKLEESVSFFKKKDYGKIPAYLYSIKAALNEDAERSRLLMSIPKTEMIPSKYELTVAELADLKAGLLQRHADVTREYQGMTHISKFASDFVIRKKERCEKELEQIERDLALFDGKKVYIDCTR